MSASPKLWYDLITCDTLVRNIFEEVLEAQEIFGFHVISESEYEQASSQSHTADKPTEP